MLHASLKHKIATFTEIQRQRQGDLDTYEQKQDQKSTRCDLCILSNLLESSRCSSQPWFALVCLGLPCVLNVHSMSIQCLFNVHKCAINVYSMCFQHIFNIKLCLP